MRSSSISKAGKSSLQCRCEVKSNQKYPLHIHLPSGKSKEKSSCFFLTYRNFGLDMMTGLGVGNGRFKKSLITNLMMMLNTSYILSILIWKKTFKLFDMSYIWFWECRNKTRNSYNVVGLGRKIRNSNKILW